MVRILPAGTLAASSAASTSSALRSASSASIFDHTQRVVGALGASVPEVRMDAERARQIGARARETAWQLSAALGATAEGVRAFIPDIRLG